MVQMQNIGNNYHHTNINEQLSSGILEAYTLSIPIITNDLCRLQTRNNFNSNLIVAHILYFHFSPYV